MVYLEFESGVGLKVGDRLNMSLNSCLIAGLALLLCFSGGFAPRPPCGPRFSENSEARRVPTVSRDLSRDLRVDQPRSEISVLIYTKFGRFTCRKSLR